MSITNEAGQVVRKRIGLMVVAVLAILAIGTAAVITGLPASANDGGLTWYLDNDGDTYGDPTISWIDSDEPVLHVPPAGYVSAGGDCDDSDHTVHPGATEIPDGIDNNCDGSIDEGLAAQDSDGDGIPDLIEGNFDFDGDGIPNYLDTDSDGDGILDSVEGTIDSDGDGTPNYWDTDSDNDGIPDSIEGTVDTDGDGIPNYLDVDSDNDGILDVIEGYTSDFNHNGIPDYLDPLPSVIDADGDGYDNTIDCDDSDATVYPGAIETLDGKDNDCDGLIDEDFTAIDSDQDGLSDFEEFNVFGTDPFNTDTDGDTFSDSEEILAGTDPLDPYSVPGTPVIDTDGDGIADGDDNCPNVSNSGQQDNDNDGVGNACDSTPNSDPVPPVPDPSGPIVLVESGVVGNDQCLVTVQKSVQSPVQDGDIVRDVEIVTVISSCVDKDGSTMTVDTSIESFIVTCEKDELLLNIVCTTTAMESAPSVDADVDGDDDSDGDRIGKKDKD
ncbi:MAG: thrombospondin type 3 repeat-containing protein [Chloroflexi bacterium]|nr:thrombospondin type 3 repeat-containing protein [Chloroflexota bacterium]